MKKIAIIGAGGLGREVAVIVEKINSECEKYQIEGFIDDGEGYYEGQIINGYPWLGKMNWAIEHKDEVSFICAIANPATKEKIMNSLIDNGVQFETIISPNASVHYTSEVGPGCVFYSGVVISSNCKIGAGVLLNEYTTVGHDVTIGDYTYVMPATGISGGCTVGKRAKIGGHVFIIPEKKVGDDATIAAGSIVFSNVRSGTTVLGNPAKRMKELE